MAVRWMAAAACLLLAGCMCSKDGAWLHFEDEAPWPGRPDVGTYRGWTVSSCGEAQGLPWDEAHANGKAAGDGLAVREFAWRPPGATDADRGATWFTLHAWAQPTETFITCDTPMTRGHVVSGPHDADDANDRAHFGAFLQAILAKQPTTEETERLWQDYLAAYDAARAQTFRPGEPRLPYGLALQGPFALADEWNQAVPEDVPLRDNPALQAQAYTTFVVATPDIRFEIAPEFLILRHEDGRRVQLDAWGRGETHPGDDASPSRQTLQRWTNEAFAAIGHEADVAMERRVAPQTCPT